MTRNSMERRPMDRRQVLTLLGALAAAGVVVPRSAFANWDKAAFEAKTMEEALQALGAGAPASSGEVQIIASDIAENGAVVPVQAISKLPNTERIAILVEKNPSMLAAAFDLSPETIPDVTARIKMGQTSNILVVVRGTMKPAVLAFLLLILASVTGAEAGERNPTHLFDPGSHVDAGGIVRDRGGRAIGRIEADVKGSHVLRDNDGRHIGSVERGYAEGELVIRDSDGRRKGTLERRR
jgi:sulfur-oxidizing protein SoxY